MGRLQSVQVLRFAAALAVVCAHAFNNRPLDHAFDIGAIGVDVFFVISGFIITRTAMRSPAGFLRNRAIRVLPPYFAVTIPWMLFCLLVLNVPLEWRRLLATLALWPATDTYAMTYLYVAWSLCYEAMFYVAVWLVLRGVKAAWLAMGYLGALILAQGTNSALIDYLGSPLTLEFLAGVGLALYPFRTPRLGLVALALGLGGVAYFSATGTRGLDLLIDGSGQALIRALSFGVPALLLVYAAVQFPKLPRVAAPLVFLGDASYSLYLTHIPVQFFAKGVFALPSIVTIAVCVLVGAVTYWYVERPLIASLKARSSYRDDPRVGSPSARSGAPDSLPPFPSRNR